MEGSPDDGQPIADTTLIMLYPIIPTLTLRSRAKASGVMACSKIACRCASRWAAASMLGPPPAPPFAEADPVGSMTENPSGISEGAMSAVERFGIPLISSIGLLFD